MSVAKSLIRNLKKLKKLNVSQLKEICGKMKCQKGTKKEMIITLLNPIRSNKEIRKYRVGAMLAHRQPQMYKNYDKCKKQECTICLENDKDGEKPISAKHVDSKIDSKNHCYHKTCLQEWKKMSGENNCPTCRLSLKGPTGNSGSGSGSGSSSGSGSGSSSSSSSSSSAVGPARRRYWAKTGNWKPNKSYYREWHNQHVRGEDGGMGYLEWSSQRPERMIPKKKKKKEEEGSGSGSGSSSSSSSSSSASAVGPARRRYWAKTGNWKPNKSYYREWHNQHVRGEDGGMGYLEWSSQRPERILEPPEPNECVQCGASGLGTQLQRAGPSQRLYCRNCLSRH